MTDIPLQHGLPWGPYAGHERFISGTGNVEVMDATAEKCAFIGRIFIEGRATGKVISAAGGGAIEFRTGSVTFANAGTTLDIGIQDVDVTTGVPFRPDGTFDVKRTLTGGGGLLTANAYHSISMTGGSGSKTINNGDLIAITFDMTARAGADTVGITSGPINSGNGNASPATIIDVGAGWAVGNNGAFAMIVFDDGTVGRLDFSLVGSVGPTNETFADATNPDERGLIFQIPFDCKIDAFFAGVRLNSATSDAVLTLYSDPLGTPTSIASFTLLAEERENSVVNYGDTPFPLGSEISLSKDTDYCLAIRASNANIALCSVTLGNTNSRKLYNGGSTLVKATRNNGSGAFSAESPALTLYNLGVRISTVVVPSGGSGGGIRMAGHGGLAA